MRSLFRSLLLFLALMSIFAKSIALKVVPWRMYNAQTENMKVVAEINESGNFSSLVITTPYGVYKMSKTELDQLSSPEVSTFEAVEFPGVKHTEYHLQFYHRGLNYRKSLEECSGDNLGSDYVRIKVRVGNKVEIKPFPSSCETSWP